MLDNMKLAQLERSRRGKNLEVWSVRPNRSFGRFRRERRITKRLLGEEERNNRHWKESRGKKVNQPSSCLSFIVRKDALLTTPTLEIHMYYRSAVSISLLAGLNISYNHDICSIIHLIVCETVIFGDVARCIL